MNSKYWILVLFLTGLGLTIEAAPARFLTYNLGLAHSFVPHAKVRRPHLISRLKQYKGDVLCLQEVWTAEDRDAVIKGLKDPYPYAIYSPIKQVETESAPACRFGDLFGDGRIVSCFQNDCSGLDGDDFTNCVITKCRPALDYLKNNRPGCGRALMASVGRSPLVTILRMLNPLWKPGTFSYDGAVGLIMMSKHPFLPSSQGYHDMASISNLTHRGILYADVEIEKKQYHLSCNHLTANLAKSAPYTGSFASWEAENLAQAAKVLELAQSKTAKGIAKIIMGDFNAGPQDFQGAWSYLVSRGLRDPVTEKKPLECTYCATENTLDEGKGNITIDHIFVGDLYPGMRLQSRILFKEFVTLEVNEGPIQSNLSDHYGVELEIE